VRTRGTTVTAYGEARVEVDLAYEVEPETLVEALVKRLGKEAALAMLNRAEVSEREGRKEVNVEDGCLDLRDMIYTANKLEEAKRCLVRVERSPMEALRHIEDLIAVANKALPRGIVH